MSDDGNSLRSAWERVSADLETSLRAEAIRYLEHLRRVSVEALREGEAILAKLADVGVQLARGEIDEDSARLAARNYVAALGNLRTAATNAEAVEELARARAVLSVLARVALALLTIGVTMGVQAVDRWAVAVTGGVSDA